MIKIVFSAADSLTVSRQVDIQKINSPKVAKRRNETKDEIWMQNIESLIGLPPLSAPLPSDYFKFKIEYRFSGERVLCTTTVRMQWVGVEEECRSLETLSSPGRLHSSKKFAIWRGTCPGGEIINAARFVILNSFHDSIESEPKYQSGRRKIDEVGSWMMNLLLNSVSFGAII